MPRQDVPYGGAICRLKERIAEIWDELGKKLHSINGVEGDGAGDVKIVSGDAAVVITSDQVNHQIEVALDSSQLPAASVSSVNGQTGAVALDAGDIPSDGNSDVQTDIDDLKTDVNANTSAIAAEALARQNADSTLQGNINTLSASIPTAAATAVANDPTVAQLATDVPNKVDKITSGSSLKAYTHTGATQGETPIVDGTTANSIGIRDANGRMQAADPASGATDKTLVTANWVSQTGDSAPNNLTHRSGNETIYGQKSYAGNMIGCPGMEGFWISSSSDTTKWRIVFSMPTRNQDNTLFRIICSANNDSYTFIEGMIINGSILLLTKIISSYVSMSADNFRIAIGADNRLYIFMKNHMQYTYGKVQILANRYNQYTNLDYSNYQFGDGSLLDEPIVGDTYTAVSNGINANVIL